MKIEDWKESRMVSGTMDKKTPPDPLGKGEKPDIIRQNGRSFLGALVITTGYAGRDAAKIGGWIGHAGWDAAKIGGWILKRGT